jgi:hypothetical protein
MGANASSPGRIAQASLGSDAILGSLAAALGVKAQPPQGGVIGERQESPDS